MKSTFSIDSYCLFSGQEHDAWRHDIYPTLPSYIYWTVEGACAMSFVRHM